MDIRSKAIILVWALLLLLNSPAQPAEATSPRQNLVEQPHLLYTVQPEDTLFSIALQHNLKLNEIMLANDIFNPNLIFAGQQLILPGIEAPPAIVPEIPSPAAAAPQIHIVRPGDTIYTIANQYEVTIDNLASWNGLTNLDLIQIGQILQIRPGPPPPPEILTQPFESLSLSNPTSFQGRTLVITVNLSEAAALNGTFNNDQPIFFYQSGNNRYWGLIALHALIEPKIYPIILAATLSDGRIITARKMVQVAEGPYGSENIVLDDSRTQLLQSDLIQQEREKLLNLWSEISPRPYWEGPFWYPVATEDLRITSPFGTRRQYNSSQSLSFHSGADFGGDVGTPIYAPAAGIVVLAEALTVRGNAIMIDHGLGLYSGYWHLSRILTAEGQEVRRGELIGYIGGTGLVTGPHLHWEMRLNGIAVSPLQWIQEAIP